jgi:anthranilate phosphoribosyltransferase
VCGTGGDGARTVNVSTAVAFTVAACGLRVMKHGGRAVSSAAGSLDALEHLGIDSAGGPAAHLRMFEATGVAFLPAPSYHPVLSRLAPLRRALGTPTIFNLLGPLLHPAHPRRQIVGVSRPDLVGPIAGALARLGPNRAMVVHGDGIDEIAVHGPTKVALIEESNRVASRIIDPTSAAIGRHSLEACQASSKAESLARLGRVLGGAGDPADRDLVAINAGAALWLGDVAPSLAAGARLALDALASGAPLEKVRQCREVAHAA